MLGDKEDGQGAPPRGCILGVAWLGIEPRTASLKVDILTQGHGGTKVMLTIHVVLIFIKIFPKTKKKAKSLVPLEKTGIILFDL